jgi:hypothetical protein
MPRAHVAHTPLLALGRGTSCLSATGVVARAARLATLRESTSRKHCPCFFNIIHASHTQPPYSHDTLTHMLTTRTDHTVHAPHADRMADPAVRSLSGWSRLRGRSGGNAERGICNLPWLSLPAPRSHQCFSRRAEILLDTSVKRHERGEMTHINDVDIPTHVQYSGVHMCPKQR